MIAIPWTYLKSNSEYTLSIYYVAGTLLRCLYSICHPAMGRYYFTDDEIEVERSSNFPKTAQLFIKWQNLKSNCGSNLTPESLILIVIPYGNFKKLQKNLTPHFTDKKASRERALCTLTPQSWGLPGPRSPGVWSWMLFTTPSHLVQSLGQRRNLSCLIPLTPAKSKAPACASEITAAGYGLSPKLSQMKAMLVPHLSLGLLFSRCFCIHFLIRFDLVTSCPPTHNGSSWHPSCPYPGRRKPYLAQQQCCVPAPALSQHDAAPQGRAAPNLLHGLSSSLPFKRRWPLIFFLLTLLGDTDCSCSGVKQNACLLCKVY